MWRARPATLAALVLVSVMFSAASCRRAGKARAQADAGVPRKATGCLADTMTSSHDGTRARTDCATTDSTCRDDCLAGDADACVAEAHAIEQDPAAVGEVALLYHHGCELGLTTACTNFAAGVWARAHSEAALECATRIFEKTCEARDHFGCGMLGRIMADSAETPDEVVQARARLEGSCRSVGGFSCRILAFGLEAGKLGDHRPERIQELLTLACQGHDDDACGAHATAAETFRPADDKAADGGTN